MCHFRRIGIQNWDNFFQAAIEAGGEISKEEAFGLGSINIEKLLGVSRSPERMDLVATRGGDLLNFGSEVVAVISPASELVNLFRKN